MRTCTWPTQCALRLPQCRCRSMALITSSHWCAHLTAHTDCLCSIRASWRIAYDIDKNSMLACTLHHKRSDAYFAHWLKLANSTTSGCSQVNLDGQWWAADVGFGSQVPREPVPLQSVESDAAPGHSGTWQPHDAANVMPPNFTPSNYEAEQHRTHALPSRCSVQNCQQR